MAHCWPAVAGGRVFAQRLRMAFRTTPLARWISLPDRPAPAITGLWRTA